MQQAPLYEALQRHRALQRAPFHTPGHKNAPAALPPALLQLDYTELPDTDSLYEADGPIWAAEQEAAQLFGARFTLFSAGGCSLCIQAMLRLACPAGGAVLCGRNAHRTAVNAMALLGLQPQWALPQDVLSALLAARPGELRACYVTSPDYYGRLQDIPALAAACKLRGIPLLVDNAHGSQLAFTQPDLHPLHQGASLCADSAHKTLNVLTGGALLHVGNFPATVEQARAAMALFGSTSPSYPIMASLDCARAWLAAHPGAFAPVQEAVAGLRALAESRGIGCISQDPTRLTLRTADIGLLGAEAAALFRAAGVEPEMADGAYVVFICTPWNTAADYRRLAQGIRSLPLGRALPPLPELPPLPPQRLLPREALLAPSHAVPLAQALGRVAAQAACPCPPGIPVLMPGEEVTAACMTFLARYGFSQLRVL